MPRFLWRELGRVAGILSIQEFDLGICKELTDIEIVLCQSHLMHIKCT